MKVVMFKRIVWNCLDGESHHSLGSKCKGFGIDLKTLFFVSFIISNWYRDAELLQNLHNWLSSSSASFQFVFMGSRLPCPCLPIVSQASCCEIRTASYRPHDAFDAIIDTCSARSISIDHWTHIGRRQNVQFVPMVMSRWRYCNPVLFVIPDWYWKVSGKWTKLMHCN
jgi:hypothetical protein